MEFYKSRVFKVNILFVLLMIIIDVLVAILPTDILKIFDQYILILLPVIIIALCMKVNLIERFKLHKFKASTIGYCFLITICIFPITSFLASLTELMFGQNPNGIGAFIESLDISPLMMLFLIAITPAICEEFMHRGLLLDKKAGVNMHVLALMSGIMFSLFHVHYDQLLYTFAMGIILGYVAIVTDSIYPAMLIHFLNNSVSVLADTLLSSLPVEEVAELSAAAEVTSFSQLPSPIYSLIAIVLIVWIIKRLIINHGYDDKMRLESCEEDTLIFKNNSKILMYSPIILMFVYVIAANMIIMSGAV